MRLIENHTKWQLFGAACNSFGVASSELVLNSYDNVEFITN